MRARRLPLPQTFGGLSAENVSKNQTIRTLLIKIRVDSRVFAAKKVCRNHAHETTSLQPKKFAG